MQRSAFFPVGVLAVVVAFHGAACSGNDDNPDDRDEQRRIEILTPPGDSIGLPFAGDVTLRVRYLGADDLPIDGAAIGFELVAGPGEDVGASALAASAAATGSAGLAEVSLVAGSGPANFRVRVTAPRAPDVFYFVVVSDSGFAEFVIDADHQGPRDEADYEVIEFRLYAQSELRCSELDIDELPPSVLPERTAPDFDSPVRFLNLAANRGYVIVAWGEPVGTDVRMGVGCVELSPTQVAESPALNIVVALADREPVWTGALTLTSVLLFPDLLESVAAIVGPDPWTTLACPLGPAQLVVDCAVDAAAPDGMLDCVIGGNTALVTAVMLARGELDSAGCRGAETASSLPSVEMLLTDHFTQGPWNITNAAELVMAHQQLLSGLTIESELTRSGEVATHRLLSLRSTAAGLSTTTDLTMSNRPVLVANASAPIELGIVDIGAHGFTLDLERALDRAFVETHLEAAGLGPRATDLGVALTDSFEDGSQTGCATISTDVCSAAGLDTSCLLAGCAAAGVQLNSRLLAWITATEADGLDLEFTGSATVSDTDFDLVVDQIGGSSFALEGSWTVVLGTATGNTNGRGAFGGDP